MSMRRIFFAELVLILVPVKTRLEFESFHIDVEKN